MSDYELTSIMADRDRQECEADAEYAEYEAHADKLNGGA